MNNRRYISFYLLSVGLLAAGCSKDSQPPATGDYTVANTAVSGLSGLCFNADRSAFYAVSDNGSIYLLNPDGSTRQTLPYTGNNDFEAITRQSSTGQIYLADESLMNLYRLSADGGSLNLVTHISIAGGVSNKGIEGLAAGNDTLYAVNQEQPAILVKYALSSAAETARIPLGFAHYLSDIFYDESDQTLWICDSYQQMIFHCHNNGELIASQSISFVAKPEALVIDHAEGVAWVGCDQTGRLYRIKLTI